MGMIGKSTRKFFNVVALTLVLMLALPWAAFADTTLASDAVLSSDAAAPTEVAPGQSKSFNIKLWAVDGNIPDGKSGIAYVVKKYTMAKAADGTIAITASTDALDKVELTFPKGIAFSNASQCPATGAPQGCASNPFVVSATVSVASDIPNGTSRQLVASIDVSNTTDGITSASQDSGWVKAVVSDATAPTSSASATVPSGASTAAYSSGSWTNKDVTVTLSANDNTGGSGVQATYYKLNAGAEQTYAAPFTVSAAGTTTVSYYSKDNVGNTETAKSFVVNIDRTAPEVSITAPAAGSYKSANLPALAYTVTEANGYTTTESGYSTAEGTHTVTVEATDAAGNKGSASRTYTVDDTAPEVSADPAGGLYNSAKSVTLSSPDSTAAIYYTLDGSAPSASSTAYSAPISISSTKTLKFIAIDPAGNASSVVSETYTIDTIAPDAPSLDLATASDSGSSDTDNVTKDNTPTFSGVAEDGSTVKIYDGANLLGTVTAGSTGWSFTAAALADGTHSITATATDAAGNVSDASAALSVRIDTVAPTAPSAGFDRTAEYDQDGTADDWYKDSVTVSYSGSTDTDGSGVDSYTVAQTFSATGTHSYSGKATDVAGNESAATTGSVKVDASAPQYDCDDAPTTWSKNDISISCTATDSDSGLASTSPFSLSTSVVAGTETVNASTGTSPVSDNVGHKVTAGPITGLKVDKKAPAVSCGVADGNWHASDVNIACIAADNGSGIATADESFNLSTSVAAGDETANASTDSRTITDGVGNSATAGPISGNKIDKKAPGIQLGATTPTTPNGQNGWYTSAVTQGFTASDGGSSLADAAQATFSKSSGTAEGSAVTIASGSVSDAVGNTNSGIDSAAFKIDLSDPTNVAFVGGPADGSSYYFGDAIPAAPTCTADDAVSRLKDCTVSGYSTAVGTHTLTATATDNAGRTATATRRYTVVGWTLKGFYAPVDMSTATTTVYNTVKNGSTVPLKFEVFKGETELKDTAVVKPLSTAKVNCETGAQEATVETTTTGSTSLRFDSTSDQFIYNWQTPKSLGCYSVTVTTQDGSALKAFFKLK